MKINFKIRSHQQIKQMKEWTNKHSPYRVWWPVQKYVHLGSNICRLCTPSSLLQHITMSISASAYSVWIQLCLVFFQSTKPTSIHPLFSSIPSLPIFFNPRTIMNTACVCWTPEWTELPNDLFSTYFNPHSLQLLLNYWMFFLKRKWPTQPE